MVGSQLGASIEGCSEVSSEGAIRIETGALLNSSEEGRKDNSSAGFELGASDSSSKGNSEGVSDKG